MSLHRQVVVRALLFPGLLILIVFGSAGKIFWQGVVYSGLTLAVLGVTYLTVRNNSDLINERLKPGEGIKGWDKAYFAISIPLYFVTIILGSLDAGRFKLSPDLPRTVYILCVIVFVLGHLIFMWARKTNNYFSSVVRIQKERGHKVCDFGPYKYIRHPGYLGGFLYNITTPLILGSIWAMIPTALTIVLMIFRTVLEDRTLEEELEGYREYKKKVQYRLIPFVW